MSRGRDKFGAGTSSGQGQVRWPGQVRWLGKFGGRGKCRREADRAWDALRGWRGCASRIRRMNGGAVIRPGRTSFLCRGRRRVEGKRTAMKTPGPISMGPGVSVDALAGRCRPKSLPGRFRGACRRLQPCLDGLGGLLVAGLLQKGEHVLLVGLDAGLVKGIYPQ